MILDNPPVSSSLILITSAESLLPCKVTESQILKNLSAVQETLVRILDWEDPLKKGTVTHSSILAWRIP